jgi:hypothetical protein
MTRQSRGGRWAIPTVTAKRTLSNKGIGKRLLVDDLEIHGRTVADLVVDIIQTPGRKPQRGCRSGVCTGGCSKRFTGTHLLSRTFTLFVTAGSPTDTPNLARLDTAAARTTAFSRTTRL